MNKCAAPDWRDKQHPAAMAKNVQAVLSKSTGQLLHHVRRRAGLPLPRLLDCAVEYRMRQTAAQTLLVKAAQLRLITVMVSRAKKRPTQSASRHIREVSLDRIGLRNVHLVEIRMGESECVSLEEFPIRRHHAVVPKLIKRRFL